MLPLFVLLAGRLNRAGKTAHQADRSVEALLEAWIQGEESAFSALMKGMAPVLRRKIITVLLGHRSQYGRLASRDDVEDVMQEVWCLLLHENARILRGYDPTRCALKSYLGLIASREAGDFLRRRLTQKAGGGKETSMDPHDPMYTSTLSAHDTEATVASAERDHRLESALLARLSERGRLFYRLLFVEELETAQIMELLQVSADAVFTWRSRIRATLREVLEAADRADRMTSSAGGA